jgi:hypothetical protein
MQTAFNYSSIAVQPICINKTRVLAELTVLGMTHFYHIEKHLACEWNYSAKFWIIHIY